VKAVTVVPVRGGDLHTADNLRAIGIAALRAGAGMIVVDNGMVHEVRNAVSKDGIAEIIECATVGSYAARNAGVATALRQGHDAILFTDADCQPQGNWPTHLLDLLRSVDVVTTVAAPRPVSPFALGANLDYRERLAEWAGGSLCCGAPIATMDTRAAAVRADVFNNGLFDTRLRFGSDAVFGRSARAAGAKVVGCHHEILSHDPPHSWSVELHKYRRIAANLVDDLRAIPRRDVLRLVPEHAHLLLPPPADVLSAAWKHLDEIAQATDPADPNWAVALYQAVRRLGWHAGWVARHEERARLYNSQRGNSNEGVR